MTDHNRPRPHADPTQGGSSSSSGPSSNVYHAYGQSSSSSYDPAMFDDAAEDLSPNPSASAFQPYQPHASHGSQHHYGEENNNIPSPSRRHNASMASSLRGKRAPAPAALDLSPPSAQSRVRQDSYGADSGQQAIRQQGIHGQEAMNGLVHQYSGLGLGVPGGSADGGGNRAVTDSVAERRASRPLPHPPARRESSRSYSSFPQQHRKDSFDSTTTYKAAGAGQTNMVVPLSAVGLGQHGMQIGASASGTGSGQRYSGQGGSGHGQRASVATAAGSERPSLDSYYFSAEPADQDQSDDDHTGYSHRPHPDDTYETTLSPGFTPVTPSMPDPFTLDRAGLIGTGELATPRWASSTLHPNLRTPAMPPMPGLSPSAPSTAVGARSVDDRAGPSDRGWHSGVDGVGLGVGVTPKVSTSAEAAFSHTPLHSSASTSDFSSPSAAAKAQARRERALSHVDSPPKKPAKSEYRGSAGPSTYRARDASLPKLTHAGSFQDFSFDSGMEDKISAAFTAPISSTGMAGRHNVSAPPPIALSYSSNSIASQDQQQQPQYSPNSARARTAARKAERERRISGLQDAAHVIPERSTSILSPPNSAATIDSMYAARQRDSRKTPPNSHMREYSAPAGTSSKGKHSPSGANHHDILRHFAPKDFSHLPPSPSSASINQFLRNSNSTGNFGVATGGSGSGLTSTGYGIGVGSPAGKTPPTTSTTHVSYFPSTSLSASNATASTPNASAYKSGLVRSDSQRSNRLKVGSKAGWEGREAREVDRETAEAMRKLDGLGSTPKGKTGSRGSKLPPPFGASYTPGLGSPSRERQMSSNSVTGFAGDKVASTPPQVPDKQIITSPLSKWDLPEQDGARQRLQDQGHDAGADLLCEPTMPAARRESPSTASFEGTPTSRDSTSITTPSSASARPDLKQRRASAGSDFSAGSDTAPHNNNASGSYEKVGEVSVPPVPPLPKGYASMRYGLSHAAGSMPPTTAPVQPAFQPLVDNSYNEPPPASASPNVTLTPVMQESPASTSSPASTMADQRPKQMNKKWSFSSAISLRLHKDTSANANTSTTSPPQMSPDMDRSGAFDESTYSWNQSFASSATSEYGQRNGLASAHAGSDSSSATASRIENRSVTSITPVGLAPPASAGPASTATKPPPTNKRLTPSGIPFFRRTSSTSTQSKITPPSSDGGKASLPPVSKIPTSTSTNHTRKSMLGMHFPSMLRSSGSKRHLSQQAPVASTQEQQDYVNIAADHKAATSGWARTRGKTMSISGPLEPKSMLPSQKYTSSATLRPKASDSSLRSGHSYVRESGSQTLRASKSGLPPISGSPAVKPQASVGSLRANENRPPLAPTPTRIPRLVSSRNHSPAVGGSTSDSMGPPPAPVAHTMSHSRSAQLGSKTVASTSSMTDFSRPAPGHASISEFGAIGVPKAHVRNTSNDPQRSRLLAPMSARNEPKPRQYAKAPEPPVAAQRPANVPPSRRTMPLPPSAAAMTISAQAKRVSRDVKPGLSRHSSKGGESGRTSTDGAASPIKPSKSLHAKLNVPSSASGAAGAASGSRIPSSSSVGATSVVNYRKVSLATSHSETPSPAEDEETLADAEMAAYVARRKARVAAGTARKDDLKDIEGFPEDIEPAQPISQRAYITQNLARLTDYERKEALDFDEIYFVPRIPIVRPPQKGGAVYNYGYDDERGDYLVVEGDHICYRYEVMGVLGKGSFGQVLECRDHKTGKSVAVKIIRNKKRFHAQAMVETKILGQLVDWDPEDKHYMVCMTDHFNFRSHLCIVTELLSINLYELIKANHFAGFTTTLIRRFTMQMLSSLQLMRSHRIVHCDLKPENILLRHPCKSGIKVIDFGSSCHETEKVYTYIQSRFYRSPEVILGMNYAMAIDMWSLGCILAELYTGVPIFPGENEHEQLACIMEVLGVPDPSIINKAQRKKLFFDTSGTPRPFVNAKGKRRRPGTKTLAQVLKCKDDLFIDFISKCLTWDPDRRLKPQPAMRHPWILAGRRRYAPPPPGPTHRTAERTSISGSTGSASGPTPLTHSRIVSSGLKSGSTSGSTSTAVPSALGPSTNGNNSDGKKQYVISPPTPLVAKTGYGQIPNSAPRIGYGAPPRVLGTRSSFIGT